MKAIVKNIGIRVEDYEAIKEVKKRTGLPYSRIIMILIEKHLKDINVTV